MKQQDQETPENSQEEAARVKSDEILGILFITIAMLLLVGWRFEQSGAFHSVASWLLASMGAGMWYLILMFALWGINKFRGRAVISDWMQLAAWVVMLPVFLGFLQSFRPVDRDLGGTIGWTLYTNLENITGTFSARVLLAGFFLILTVVCLDTPLTQIVASGYRAGGKATGVVWPVLTFPAILLYTAIFHLLTFVHMLVFILLKDLVVLFDVLYDRLMTTEEPLPAPDGEGALVGPVAGSKPAAAGGRESEPPRFHSAVEPVVELDRPGVAAAPHPPSRAASESPAASSPGEADLPPPGALDDDSTQGIFLMGGRSSETASARQAPVEPPPKPAESAPAAPAVPAPAPAPTAPVAASSPLPQELLGGVPVPEDEVPEEEEEEFQETEEELRQAEAMHNI
ncbi:MAG: hypothetical protein HY303_09545, partial [Candidatus Wallbacteria bacterium]|nr:hypothetical protein [Candidatus Wallbacteria bacterium]